MLVREYRAGAQSRRAAPAETTIPDLTIYTRHLLGQYGLKTVQRLAALGAAMQPKRAADFERLSKLAAQMDADGVCCRVSQLAVNGRDLMAAGIPAGPGLRGCWKRCWTASSGKNAPTSGTPCWPGHSRFLRLDKRFFQSYYYTTILVC